ncbi:hypothetical protein IE81DRAFT_324966 [Ceraceosorus guamensis]|uniref:FAS1 domain-containing protein n=1 Tax=Ceraceosorus guamensis TaxID=1522189 RepID=A0A316VUD1_9BASI|nr:hypothetical protein IE81DRAFT_324966 [Ceraceosorus guamensis]PWN41050.1 hypothetical protein IE81DRAFT_324966 [Ceraceosorus guamensis]
MKLLLQAPLLALGASCVSAASISTSSADAAADAFTLSTALGLPSAPASLIQRFTTWLGGNAAQVQATYESLGGPVEGSEDKSLLEIIKSTPDLSFFAKILNYSSDSTKELLDGGKDKLTLLAPLNWHHDDHAGSDIDSTTASIYGPRSVIAHWAHLESSVDELSASSGDDDDEEKRKRRAAIRYLIDLTVRYHLIAPDSGAAVTAKQIAAKSSVATELVIPASAEKYVGKLLGGAPFRLRSGKSLLPRPGVYFNFFSRLVQPDVKASGGSILHAVSLPLLIPPSDFQTVLFGSAYNLGATATALYRTGGAGFFTLPHLKHDDDKSGHAAQFLRILEEKDDDGYKAPALPGPGEPGITLFAPTNLAWTKVPARFKFFLLSPFGTRLLAKAFMLHALPINIVYADAVYQYDFDEDKAAFPIHGKHSVEHKPLPVNVTTYELQSALPKLKHKHHHDGDADATKKPSREIVTVKVYCYPLVPGGGPLQTRVEVQGVPVVVQDIPTANGAVHLIDSFIMPKGHEHGKSIAPGQEWASENLSGVWKEIDEESARLGFSDDQKQQDL